MKEVGAKIATRRAVTLLLRVELSRMTAIYAQPPCVAFGSLNYPGFRPNGGEVRGAQ